MVEKKASLTVAVWVDKKAGKKAQSTVEWMVEEMVAAMDQQKAGARADEMVEKMVVCLVAMKVVESAV